MIDHDDFHVFVIKKFFRITKLKWFIYVLILY